MIRTATVALALLSIFAMVSIALADGACCQFNAYVCSEVTGNSSGPVSISRCCF